MTNPLQEYQDYLAFLREQMIGLPEAEFHAWLDSLPDEDRAFCYRLMGDPAFSLQDHQVMPKLDEPAYHVDDTGQRVVHLDSHGQPVSWRTWFKRMGRGAGKTHGASAAVNLLARYAYPGCDGLLVGPDHKHVREIMVEGESGLINTAPADFKPVYQPMYSRVVWPNGSKAIIFTADDPQAIRGPSVNWAWGDELAKWKSEESYKNLLSTLRNKHPLGNRLILTTSPISSKKWIRAIEQDIATITTVATSLDNVMGLDPSALAAYEREIATGSRRAREEYLGEWVEDTDKLWTIAGVEALTVTLKRVGKGTQQSAATTLTDICQQMDGRLLSIDPGGKTDENGIILLGEQGDLKWALHDFSMSGSKSKWMAEVKAIADRYLKAGDRIIVETNVHNDADEDIRAMLPHLYVERIHQNNASGGKIARAERAQVLYEDDKVRHFSHSARLVEQMDSFYDVVAHPHKSPDRVDALVNGLNWYQSRKRPSFSVWTVPQTSFDH